MSDWAFLASPIGRQEREQLLGSQRPRAPVAGSTSITPPTMPICYSSIDAGLSHSGLFRRSACRRSSTSAVRGWMCRSGMRRCASASASPARGAARRSRPEGPGPTSDASDATWLAQLGAHGLVRGSFVPPAPIRELRDLTRARTIMTRDRSREIQRLEKLLEDAGIKLSSVASDITGVSGRLMLQALIDGQRDPVVLADLAQRRLTIRGIGPRCTEVVLAETGADMSIFPTAAHLASWAGTCPGSNEYAGRVKSTATRPGNPYLKAALGAAALSGAHAQGT